MNYREAAQYTDRSTIEVKEELQGIVEAMEEIGHGRAITIGLIDFWLNGSTLVNYEIYLDKFNAYKLLTGQGIPAKYISNALSSDSVDKYLLFKNAALNFIGEELTPDFKSLVIDPLIKICVAPSDKERIEKLEQLTKGREVIKGLEKSVSKAISELNKIKPYHIAGTDVESVLIKLEQIEHTITHQLSEN